MFVAFDTIHDCDRHRETDSMQRNISMYSIDDAVKLYANTKHCVLSTV